MVAGVTFLEILTARKCKCKKNCGNEKNLKMLCSLWPSSTYSHLPECIGLRLVSQVDEEIHTRVGVCLDGKCEGKILVMTEDEDFTSATTPYHMTVHMFASNPFGLALGPCDIKVDPKNPSELQQDDLGLTMFGEDVVAVTLDIATKTIGPIRKKRTILQPANLSNGTSLTTKETLHLLAKWLDVQNGKYASKYGLTQLVWSEQHTSSRSSNGGNVRGWFRHDVSDGCKRKVCPHACGAIEHMEKIIGINFYDDIKKNGFES